jgi:hypothetical protein
MDAKQLFFERYHGFREYPELLVAGMTEQQLRHSPHPAVNPITWILWHIARCEDMGVNRLIVDRPQVLDDRTWASRLGVPERHIGTGMTKKEVIQLSDRLSLSDLLAYRAAVSNRTEEAINSLPSHELTSELRVGTLRQVFVGEGAGGSAADQLVEVYAGHTKGWLLGHISLTHHYYHIGQAFAVRRMYGIANPW